jgi:hypothetical protein
MPPPDGFKLGQFLEREINMNVHDLRHAVAELQRNQQLLIDEINRLNS